MDFQFLALEANKKNKDSVQPALQSSNKLIHSITQQSFSSQSSGHHKSQTIRGRELNLRECSPSTKCQMSHVTCYVLHVMCLVSCVLCHYYFYFCMIMWWSQSVEGLLSTGLSHLSNIQMIKDGKKNLLQRARIFLRCFWCIRTILLCYNFF